MVTSLMMFIYFTHNTTGHTKNDGGTQTHDSLSEMVIPITLQRVKMCGEVRWGEVSWSEVR